MRGKGRNYPVSVIALSVTYGDSSPKGRALGIAAKFLEKAIKFAVSPEPLPLGEVARRKP